MPQQKIPPEVNVISRTEWGALPPRGDVEPVTHPLEKVFITMDTASHPCYDKETCLGIVADLQKRHMTNDGAPDIRYNFLVGGDGNVYEGRGWHQKPQLAKEEKYFEDKSLDIAYIGTYEVVDCPMSYYEKFADLILVAVTKKYLALSKLFILDYLDLATTKRVQKEFEAKQKKMKELHASKIKVSSYPSKVKKKKPKKR
ncbi:peptidoglycan-recognition protein SD-like isoform X1 [Macrosteles quadrilineatus]|uniref:peptidoglycan-recognition protein SD-like isoform X1 n=1 Tax=Macrosteles quadrilineatus TaxID=74068 RepID=UPI0023E0BA58|nr:peptidoglycan-recognition protein SD-like isoform X1 [Macrosteles quadrilineatus]